MMSLAYYHRRFCRIVPIIFAINLVYSSVCFGGHGNTKYGNESSPARGRDAQFQLDLNKSSTGSSLPGRNLTILHSRDNPLKSRFKKTNVVLTLSLRPKEKILKPKNKSEALSATEVMTSKISDLTVASFKIEGNATKRPFTILDRLRKLTNRKIKESTYTTSTGMDFGYKNSPFAQDEEINDKNEKVTTENPDSELGKKLATKIGGHLSHNLPKSDFKSKPTLTVVIQPITLPGSGLLTTVTTEHPNTGEKLQAGSEVDEERIEKEETRYITADQIGGNRPTQMPFHFTTTTTTLAPITKPPETKRPIKRYRKPHSPHNHIYAPTQDPINIAHNEDDLSVQDVQDYRAAHLTFGSKVGTEVITGTERPTIPPPPTQKIDQVTRPSVYRGLPSSRSRSPPPTTTTRRTTVHPQSASSGVKNSHIKIKPNPDSVNDNLPFYKEPGGIFEHKYHDNDNEQNEVNHQFDDRSRSPEVRYAPKGPSSYQPQQQQINYNNENQNHYQNPPLAPQQQHQQRRLTSPQYVTVTQQPVYLSPIPVQQVAHTGYNGYPTQNAPPQQNYYPPQQHQQHYYQAPVPAQHFQVQNQPVYNQAPAAITSTPGGSGYHLPYPPTQSQPIYLQPTSGLQPNNPNRFVHLSQPQTTTDYGIQQGDHNPLPPRYDPASDYYYGDPRPPKLAAKVPAAPHSRPSKKRADDADDDEEQEEEEKPKPKSSRNRDRNRDRDRDRGKYNKDTDGDDEEDSKKPRKPSRNNSPRNNKGTNYDPDYDDGVPPPIRGYKGGRERDSSRRQSKIPGYEDYDSDPNENIGEFVKPAQHLLSQRAYNDGKPSADYGGLDSSFRENNRDDFNPSSRDKNFRPSPPDNSPNFDHPNIEYPSRRSQPHVEGQEEKGSQKRIGFNDNDDRFDTRLPPLDPIYTKTLKEYDEENAPRDQRPDRKNSHRYVEPDEDYPPPPFEVNEDPPSRGERPSPPSPEEEDFDDQPLGPLEPGRGGSRRKPPANDDDEDDRPVQNEEDEESEDKERPQQKESEQNQKPQEEEEEEEEEEEPDDNTSRKSKRQEKKPPPEKPKSEKTGNLDDDISSIEQEFGTVPTLDLPER